MPNPRFKPAHQIWKEKEIDFDALLEPYREGGTPTQPVRRTMGTMLDYLLNKKKYPKEVAGAALLVVFSELKAGLKFEGDGSYGSPGRQLITYVRRTCDEILHKRQKEDFHYFAKDLQKALEGKPRLKGWFRRNWKGILITVFGLVTLVAMLFGILVLRGIVHVIA